MEKKITNSMIYATYFIIDSDLLLKYAPPIEQTHYFQTCPIHEYKKYVSFRAKCEKKPQNNKIKNQNSLNNNTNINKDTINYNYLKLEKYNTSNNPLQETIQYDENQLDKEIKATKKRLKELYAQKQQLMEKRRKELAKQHENQHKNNKLNDYQNYYDQYYWIDYWNYAENLPQKYKSNYYDGYNYSQFPQWIDRPKQNLSQNDEYEKSTNKKEKSKKTMKNFWYNY